MGLSSEDVLGALRIWEWPRCQLSKLRLVGLSSEDLGPPNSSDLRLMDPRSEDFGGPKSLG